LETFDTYADAAKVVAECFPGADSEGYRFVNGLLEQLSGELPVDELMFLRVTEPGNARSSFDLKLYDAQWTLGSVARDLQSLSGRWGVPAAALEQQLAQNADRALGHIAGGTGRKGEEFVTCYFGVEGF
jgi:hypothetical protein